jgi:CHAT domain-containing protein/tetratricopeptide (TPR) repeat protein
MDLNTQSFGLSLFLMCTAIGSFSQPTYAQEGQHGEESSYLLSIEGELSEEDATLEDGSLYDVYPFEGEAGQIIKIELESDEFDTYLILADENGQTIGENDDNNGETNSSLTIELPRSATYQIVANSYDSSGRGQYFLNIVLAKEINAVIAEADRLTQAGISSYQEASYHEALELFGQALNIQHEIGNRFGESTNLNHIGVVYASLGQYSQALNYYQQALAIRHEIGNRLSEGPIFNNIGAIYDRLGQYSQALDYYQQALAIQHEIGDRFGKGRILSNIGAVYINLGQYAQALNFSRKALIIQREIDDRFGESTTLNNFGRIYGNSGQYSQALDYYQQTLAIQREIGDRFGEGSTLSNIGVIYSELGQHLQALDIFQQALAIQYEIGDRSGEGTTLNNIGVIYSELGQYTQALDHSQKALIIRQEIGDRFGEGETLNNIGAAYNNLGQYEQALNFYQQALAILREIGVRAGEGTTLNNIGVIYSELGQYEQALDVSQKALVIRQEIGDLYGEGVTLRSIGATFHQTAQYVDAENTLYQAITVFEALREGNLEDIDKIALFETQLEVYALLQQVLTAQNKTESALEVAERGRARVLVESLTLGFSENSDRTIVSDSPDLEEIHHIAQEQNATLVSYSIIDVEVPELYIWVVSPDGNLTFRSLSLENQSLRNVVDDLRVTVRGHNRGRSSSIEAASNNAEASLPASNTGTGRTSRNLYLQNLHQLLIDPIADLLPTDPETKIVFIPHGELFLVPFSALMDDDGTYLIEKHTVLTAPSIQVLDLTRQQRQSTQVPGTANVLVVGNPTMPSLYYPGLDDYDQLDPLPGAEQEAAEIAQLLNTQPLLGDVATEADLKQRMASAHIIHLATHGLLEYGDPRAFGVRDMPGAVALAPGNGEDGLLTSLEILNLDLNADLVVLSACDTGLGEITGDGVIGLSRSFVAAGVPSVIVSLWAVPDAPTAELMGHFYQNLQQGQGKAQALRQAMLTTMQTHPNPRDWAAFTLIGEAE